MKRVLVVQESLPHYRVALFEGLRRSLAAEGVLLDLVHGRPSRVAATP